MVKRRVYKHEFLDFDRPDIPDISDDYHNIDLPVASLQINTTKFYNGLHLSYEQWHALPDNAKKIWDMLN